MLKANLRAINGALNIRYATRSIMARAKGILGAAAASRRRTILLRIIAFAKSMKDRLSAIERASADRLARDKIKLLKNENLSDNTSTALLKEILISEHALIEIPALRRDKNFNLFLRFLAALTGRLIGDERDFASGWWFCSGG